MVVRLLGRLGLVLAALCLPVSGNQAAIAQTGGIRQVDFDAISNDAYTPNLDYLDKMMASLSVHPTGINETPGMPGTGDSIAGTAILALLGIALLSILGGLIIMRKRR